jgi:Phosphoinositide phospholipase C, Ca2+-dependent
MVAVALLAAGCSGSGGSTGDATTTSAPADAAYPLDDELRLNQIQALGTHNSYHVEAAPDLLSVLRAFEPALADSIQYGHPPLDEQFDAGIRQIELDVFTDPDGGLYANRAGLATVGRPTASGLPELDEPGFKVLHVQDIDFDTTCLTFVACLTTVREWSAAHPGHVPIMIQVEAKADAIPDPANLGFVVPHAIGAPELDALDAEIRSVFTADEIVTPDDVRGQHATLEEAVLAGDWPTLGESRGKVLFTLDNEDVVRDAYVAGHPSLEGRILFTSSPPGTPEAAFVKRNDPLADTDIADLVRRGYVVRTRSDADTVQARTGDTTMRDAALRSGAQWVSTDYPEPDPRFTDYSVAIPGGTPARCNPVAAPPDCTPADVENPSHLTTR